MQMKELLELRKRGKFAEAYAGICEIFAQTKNRYTALALFWGADDLFRLRMKEGKIDEARRLLYDMVKVYPIIDDNDLRANRKIVDDALALDKVKDNFNLTYFLPYFFRLPKRDWKDIPAKGYKIPSVGQQVANRLMGRILTCSDDYIRMVMPFFRFALSINPTSKDNLRHLARLYKRVGLKQQSIKLYKRLLLNNHDSYLFAELSELVDGVKEKTVLLSQAIYRQKDEKYNIRWRYELAVLLMHSSPERAAYEIRKCIAEREKLGIPLSAEVDRVARLLEPYEAVGEMNEREFYKRCGIICQEMFEK